MLLYGMRIARKTSRRESVSARETESACESEYVGGKRWQNPGDGPHVPPCDVLDPLGSLLTEVLVSCRGAFPNPITRGRRLAMICDVDRSCQCPSVVPIMCTLFATLRLTWKQRAEPPPSHAKAERYHLGRSSGRPLEDCPACRPTLCRHVFILSRRVRDAEIVAGLFRTCHSAPRATAVDCPGLQITTLA